ncbi:c-type cytochrome [Thioalkalivibrio paradoxus]|uniref:Cytochrome C n=1 Tax=Thioalkalivibrio paradoxus ARh 1 TaxID=713585 RepID=W0DF99_9GAMM|nr:cytochrome c [Thioalkalivibrio paradoxus]AHE97041.1 cytochrome C [Thioalkalivibrio paradoxus ARh 1]
MQRTMRMSRNVFVATAAVLALGLPASGVAFDEGAEATIDYRQGVMRAIGGNVASTAAIVVDGADYRDNLEMHTRYLVDATRDIPGLFPEGSDFGETDALAAVWEEPEKFAERSRETHEAAVALHEAVERGDDAAIGQGFRALGQSCRSCHEDFRHRD